MTKYFISLWWLCLVVTDASPVASPSRGVPDLFTACARMDIWDWGEVAKTLCDAACAVSTLIKSQGRPVCSCSRCAPGVGGGIDCALSEKRWNQPQSKRKQRLIFKKVSFQLFLLLTPISSSKIRNNSSTSSRSLPKKGDLSISSRSPSSEKLRRIHRIKTLVLPRLWQDCF